MSMTIHLLLQLWSPFVFCSHNHFSDCFQWFTDGSLLAILILPIILAFFCWTMRPDMHGIDTHRLHLMLLLIHTCELQQGFAHPKKMIQVVLADDPEAINDTFASRIYIYPDEPPDPYTVHLWWDLTGPVGRGPVATRDTAIEAGDRQSPQPPQAPQPAASVPPWRTQPLVPEVSPTATSQDFPFEARLLLHGLCGLPAFVTFTAFIEVFGGPEKEGWSYGMPRCLQEVEVLDLDWGPMRSPLESLPSTNFIQWGYSYTQYSTTIQVHLISYRLHFTLLRKTWTNWWFERFFNMFHPLIYLGKIHDSHFHKKSTFFSDGLVKHPPTRGAPSQANCSIWQLRFPGWFREVVVRVGPWRLIHDSVFI